MCEHGTITRVSLAHPRKLDGKQWAGVDSCIAPLVQALNSAGIQTVASCCGHGHRPGSIILEDDRELIVTDYQTARSIDHLWPDIHGADLGRPAQMKTQP